MGAGINDILARGVQPINIDPLAAQMRVTQLRDMYAQQKEREQKTEEARLKNEEMTRQTRANQSIGQLIAANTSVDPQTGKPVVDHSAIVKGIASTVGAKEASAYDAERRADEAAQIKNTNDKLAGVEKQNKMIGDKMGSLSNTPDADLPEAYDNIVNQLATDIGPQIRKHLPPSAFVTSKGGAQPLRALVTQEANAATANDAQIKAHQADLTHLLDVNKFNEQIATDNAEIGDKRAATAEKNLAVAAQMFSAAGTNPKLWQSAIGAIQNNPWLPDSHKDLILKTAGAVPTREGLQAMQRLATPPKEAETGRHNLAEEVGQEAQRTQMKDFQTAATENQAARLRLEQSKNAREEQIYQQTYGAGANPALVGVEPKLRVQAAGASQKAATEYAGAVYAADEMKSLIDLARSGNKVAYAYAPTTGVLTINSANGVKRINMLEISQYGGAGSFLDKVTGFLGKQASGASIPSDVLDDMEKLHSKLGEVATQNYNTKLNGINQNYRSNFQPVQVHAASGGGAPTGHQVGDTVKVGNKKVKITAIHQDGTFDGDEVK